MEAARSNTARRRTRIGRSFEGIGGGEEQLRLAQNAVAQIDVSQLEVERSQYSNDLRILSQWKTQFVEFCGLRDLVVELTAKCASLNEEQAKRLLGIWRSQMMSYPKRKQRGRLNRQFNRMRDALDDAAKRVPLYVTDGEPCPVCGSLDHPYTHEDRL